MSENEIIERVQKNVESPTISSDTGLEAARKIGEIAERENIEWALVGGIAIKQANITMKTNFAFTHWACFDCRKSFAKEESETPRKCPECANAMIDMGAYFEPPRKLSKKRWEVMKILADYGFRFNTKDSKTFIQNRILQVKNPRIEDVIERIQALKQC